MEGRLTLYCHKCGYTRDVVPELLGKSVHCPQCNDLITLMGGVKQVGSTHKPPTTSRRVQGEMRACPYCTELISIDAKKCKYCKEIVDVKLRDEIREEKVRTMEKIAYGSTPESPSAKASMVCGVIGLLVCWTYVGLAVGPLAVILSFAAKRELAKRPGLKGAKSARAGLILGIITIILSVVFMIVLWKAFSGGKHPGIDMDD